MTNGNYDQPFGASPSGGDQPRAVSLDSLTIELTMLDVLPGAFMRRHRFLPYQVVGPKVHVITADPSDHDLTDELRFVTGLDVVTETPVEGNVDKLIDAAISAWKKGEKTLVTSGHGDVVADADLVYLEDLGSLGDSSEFAGSGGGMSAADRLGGQGGGMSLSDGLGDGGRSVSASAAYASLTAPRDKVITGNLPVVVDLEPRLKSGSHPVAVVPDPSGEPPSAHATTIEASNLGEEGLLDDMGLLDDIDLVDADEPSAPSLEAPTLPVSETPVPSHRPAEGLTSVIADGNDADRQRLSRIGYSLGFTLEQASRTLDVIQLLEEQTPDLVILDDGLTGTHPFTLVKQLREEDRFDNTALVVTSRMPRNWRIVQDLRDSYGVNGYLEKPYDTGMLLWVMQDALNDVRNEPVQLRDPEVVLQANALLSRGSTLYRRGALDEAIDLFEEGIELDPHLPSLHVSLAVALVKQRRLFHAMTSFERAIALDSTLTTAMSNLAMLYEKKGFRHKTFELWERTLHATKDEEKRIVLRARIAKALHGSAKP